MKAKPSVLVILFTILLGPVADVFGESGDNKGREEQPKADRVAFYMQRLSSGERRAWRPRFLKTKDAFFVSFLKQEKFFSKLVFRQYSKHRKFFLQKQLMDEKLVRGGRLQILDYDLFARESDKGKEELFVLHSNCTLFEGIAPTYTLSQLRPTKDGNFTWTHRGDVIDKNEFYGVSGPKGVALPHAFALEKSGKKNLPLLSVFNSPNVLWFSESRDGGVKWSSPQEITRKHDGPIIALHRKEKPKPAIYLFYNFYSKSQRDLRVTRREDGKTWEKSRVVSIPDEWTQKIAELAVTSDKKGTWWMAFSAVTSGHDCSIYVTRSEGDGTQWAKPIPLTTLVHNDHQPAIAVHDGKLVIAFRRGHRLQTQVWFAMCPVDQLQFLNK
ncbi:MAG: sialidase family protein [Gemmataceae bacterium]